MTGKFQQIIFLVIVLGLISCNNKNEVGETKGLRQDEVTEKLLDANIAAIEFENKQIDKLIDSSGWNMIKTATGLRYEIIEKGNGPQAEIGKTARFEYEIKLLSGGIIYSSKIGSGGVESGLEEGILNLMAGDRARFIIPSYLAHGLSGDQDQIPPKSTLIYTVKLIDLK
jgi:FKBP-type peptidyl-prolyl cis-trans isomerase FkpA